MNLTTYRYNVETMITDYVNHDLKTRGQEVPQEIGCIWSNNPPWEYSHILS